MRNRCLTPRTAFVALAGIILLTGCGELSRQPLAPDRTSVPQKAGDPFTIALSSETQDRAAKPVRGRRVYTKTAEERFSPESRGSLGVSFPEYAGTNQMQVKTATLAVAKGSINRRAQIAMTVTSGSSLADIRVRFSPSHVVRFSPPATLTLVLQGGLGRAKLSAYHFSEGRTISVSTQTTAAGGKEWKVTIQILGFSSYSLGDELVPESGDGF